MTLPKEALVSDEAREAGPARPGGNLVSPQTPPTGLARCSAPCFRSAAVASEHLLLASWIWEWLPQSIFSWSGAFDAAENSSATALQQDFGDVGPLSGSFQMEICIALEV